MRYPRASCDREGVPALTQRSSAQQAVDDLLKADNNVRSDALCSEDPSDLCGNGGTCNAEARLHDVEYRELDLRQWDSLDGSLIILGRYSKTLG